MQQYNIKFMINPQEYTILLAEDNVLLRRRLIRQLRQLTDKEFSVLIAFDGKWLYEKARDYKDDLSKLVILADTEMSELNGDEACRKLLEDERFRRVIMIGMSEASENEQYWKGVGIKDYSFFLKTEERITNFADFVFNAVNSIVTNPAVYRLPDGSYRRDAV